MFHAIADKAKYPSSALSPTGRSQQLRSSRSANRIEGNAPQTGVCILLFFFLRHLFFFHKNQRGRVQQDGCSNVSQWPKPEWEAPTVWLHDDQIRGDLLFLMFYFFLWASEWKRELVGREQYCVQHKGDVDFKYIYMYTGKWKKLCREQCETDSMLRLEHTMIQCFCLSFNSFFSFVSFEMIVCHFFSVFKGVLASFAKTLWLCF